MSEKITSEGISRRKALSLMGLAAALSLTVPPTVLMVSNADAQQTAPPPAAPPSGPQTGTERREERRGPSEQADQRSCQPPADPTHVSPDVDAEAKLGKR